MYIGTYKAVQYIQDHIYYITYRVVYNNIQTHTYLEYVVSELHNQGDDLRTFIRYAKLNTSTA